MGPDSVPTAIGGISRVDLAVKPYTDSRDPRLLLDHPRLAGLSCYQTEDQDRADGTI